MSTPSFPPLPPGMDPTFHPDLHPYDQALNEADADLEAGRKRYDAALAELNASILALPALVAAAQEASGNWATACESFCRLHQLDRNHDLGFEATKHLPVQG